jgi:hypothetical protein
MIDLTPEPDVDTLRQVSLLLDREVQRLITKNLQLTTELARLRGVPDPEQLALAELRALEQRRAQVLTSAMHAVAVLPVAPRLEPGRVVRQNSVGVLPARHPGQAQICVLRSR